MSATPLRLSRDAKTLVANIEQPSTRRFAPRFRVVGRVRRREMGKRVVVRQRGDDERARRRRERGVVRDGGGHGLEQRRERAERQQHQRAEARGRSDRRRDRSAVGLRSANRDERARGERGGVARERVPRGEPPREQRRGGGRLERDDRELLRDGGGVQRDAREPARDHAPVQHEALQEGIVRVVVGVPLALVQDSAPRQRGIVFVPVGIRAGRVRTIARGRGGGGPTTLGDAHVRRDARPGRRGARARASVALELAGARAR